MSLYIKHRPDSLEKIEGNGALITELSTMFKRNRKDIPHAFMLIGPSGCGKTTIGRIIATELKCDIQSAYHEMDSAQYSGIDKIRELRRDMMMAPPFGDCNVYLIDECHKLSGDAQNALLKALEDTPSHVYFILATTDPEKMLRTVRNRCTCYEVEKLSPKRMERLIQRIAQAEKLKLSPKVVERIVEVADGSPRSALVNLDKIVGLDAEEAEAAVLAEQMEEAEAIDVARLLLKGARWKDIAERLKRYNGDPESARRCILGYMNAVLLNSGQEKAYLIMDAFRKDFFTTGKAGLTMACYEALEGGK